MKQSHHVPPHRIQIEVVNPTLRRVSTQLRWRITNILTCGAALLAVVLSVSLSSAATDTVCPMPLGHTQAATCE